MLILLVVLASVVALLCMRPSPQEPYHKGKSLTYWLTVLEQPRSNESRKDGVAAVRQIGTNALPRLVALVQAKDSVPKAMLLESLPGGWHSFLRLTPTQHQRLRAVQGFEVLGPAAATSIPYLLEALRDSEVCVEVALALLSIGTEGAHSLTNGLVDPDDQVRERVLSVMNSHLLPTKCKNVEQVTPVLMPHVIRCLRDQNPDIRMLAASVLGSLAKDGKIAVP
ncbi:MAG TPA: HEAT repeat domain-containing protein, partial [Clostridia bacterium]|nr:HEAT repeat domain-containing protein [Clostridia bacterium]